MRRPTRSVLSTKKSRNRNFNLIDFVQKWNTKRRRAGQATDFFRSPKKKKRVRELTRRPKDASNVTSTSVDVATVLELRDSTSLPRRLTKWRPRKRRDRPNEQRRKRGTISIDNYLVMISTGTSFVVYSRSSTAAVCVPLLSAGPNENLSNAARDTLISLPTGEKKKKKKKNSFADQGKDRTVASTVDEKIASSSHNGQKPVWPTLACNKQASCGHRGSNLMDSLQKSKTKRCRTGHAVNTFATKKNAFADRGEDRTVAPVDKKIASCSRQWF